MNLKNFEEFVKSCKKFLKNGDKLPKTTGNLGKNCLLDIDM